MAHPKFLFDRSFDVDAPPAKGAEVEEVQEEEEEPEYIAPSFSEEELEAAKTEAFQKGKEEGSREASDTIENQLVDATKAINQQITKLINHQQLANCDIFRDAVKIAHAITRKSFPKLNADHGLAEIDDIVYNLLPQILAEPRVVIHVHPDISENLSQRVEQISNDAHFEGRVIITADESIEAGDCKVEWGNGGAERNLEEIMLEIDAVISTNLEIQDSKYVPSPDALDDETIKPLPSLQSEKGESLPEKDPEPALPDPISSENQTPNADSEQAQPAPENPVNAPEKTPGADMEQANNIGQKDQKSGNNSAISAQPDDIKDTESSTPPPGTEIPPDENSQTKTSEGV